jgi:hypothetical protein
MPTTRSLLAGLALALTAISCSQDKGPTAPTDDSPTLAQTPTATGPLQAVYTTPLQIVTTTGQAVGTFVGTVTINSFQTLNGQLVAVGTATGTLTNLVTGAVTTLTNTAFASVVTPAQQRCPILQLDIGRIFLDLLGLQVDLAPIHLNITAVAGPGNLLGNLLCALVHLLDQNPLAAGIAGLLQQINAILAG